LSIIIDSVVFVFFCDCNLLHKEHFTITTTLLKKKVEHVTITILGLPVRELPVRELPFRKLPFRKLPLEKLLREKTRSNNRSTI